MKPEDEIIGVHPIFGPISLKQFAEGAEKGAKLWYDELHSFKNESSESTSD